MKHHLCRHDGVFTALTNRMEAYRDRVVRLYEDANAVVREMLVLAPKPAPAFAFLDPEGSELAPRPHPDKDLAVAGPRH